MLLFGELISARALPSRASRTLTTASHAFPSLKLKGMIFKSAPANFPHGSSLHQLSPTLRPTISAARCKVESVRLLSSGSSRRLAWLRLVPMRLASFACEIFLHFHRLLELPRKHFLDRNGRKDVAQGALFEEFIERREILGGSLMTLLLCLKFALALARASICPRAFSSVFMSLSSKRLISHTYLGALIV